MDGISSPARPCCSSGWLTRRHGGCVHVVLVARTAYKKYARHSGSFGDDPENVECPKSRLCGDKRYLGIFARMWMGSRSNAVLLVFRLQAWRSDRGTATNSTQLEEDLRYFNLVHIFSLPLHRSSCLDYKWLMSLI